MYHYDYYQIRVVIYSHSFSYIKNVCLWCVCVCVFQYMWTYIHIGGGQRSTLDCFIRVSPAWFLRWGHSLGPGHYQLGYGDWSTKLQESASLWLPSSEMKKAYQHTGVFVYSCFVWIWRVHTSPWVCMASTLNHVPSQILAVASTLVFRSSEGIDTHGLRCVFLGFYYPWCPSDVPRYWWPPWSLRNTEQAWYKMSPSWDFADLISSWPGSVSWEKTTEMTNHLHLIRKSVGVITGLTDGVGSDLQAEVMAIRFLLQELTCSQLCFLDRDDHTNPYLNNVQYITLPWRGCHS